MLWCRRQRCSRRWRRGPPSLLGAMRSRRWPAHAFVPCIAAVGLHCARSESCDGRASEALSSSLPLRRRSDRAGRWRRRCSMPVADNLWLGRQSRRSRSTMCCRSRVRSAKSDALPAAGALPALRRRSVILALAAGLHDFASLFAGRSLLGSLLARRTVTQPADRDSPRPPCAGDRDLSRALAQSARVLNTRTRAARRGEAPRAGGELRPYGRTPGARPRGRGRTRAHDARHARRNRRTARVGTLRSSKTGDVSAARTSPKTLRDALADLRLAIDSLERRRGRPAGAARAGARAARAAPRARKASASRGRWRTCRRPSHFGPEQTLHVLRVLPGSGHQRRSSTHAPR